jgi:site-specific DNA recombinase
MKLVINGKELRRLEQVGEGLLSLEQLRERMPALRHRQQTLSAELQAIADRTNDRATLPAPGRDSRSIPCSLAQCGGNA